MLSDYVMNSIDHQFANNLLKNNQRLTKNINNSNKNNFNRDTIKNNLNHIIRKNGQSSKSPACQKDKSSSPISKSRLKSILENNKSETIRSVIKRSSNFKDSTSPYKNILNENNSYKSKTNFQISQNPSDYSNKENDLIKYYRDERKSLQKTFAAEKSIGKTRKSRIFLRPSPLSHQVSKIEFR